MSIGTAKPSLEEQDGVQHYMIDSHHLIDEITSAQFAKETEQLLFDLFKVHDAVILVGGSGMFVDALCHGIDDIPKDKTLKNELIQQVELEGLSSLLFELKEKDIETYNSIDHANPNRIIRAIEAIRLSGKKLSELKKGNKKNHFFEIHRFIIDIPRDILYQRINQRVDLMMENGLENEVKSLLKFQHLSSFQTVGYKEFMPYFRGEQTLEKTVELIKQHSRNYAKRQITWNKKYTDTTTLNFNQKDQWMQIVNNVLHLKQ